MIRHNILFKVKSTASSDDIDQAIAAMQSHTEELSGVFSIIGGECQFHDEKSMNFYMHDISRGASHCISIDFRDRGDLESFFKNPALQISKNMIVDITERGYEGIVAFDLEMQLNK